MKHRLEFVFLFQPLVYLHDPERKDLERHLIAADSPTFFQLNVLRRKHLWAFAVPRGGFANDYSLIDHEREDAARRTIFMRMKPRLFRARDVIERNGVTYYHRAVLERARDLVEPGAHRALFAALIHAINAATANPHIVMGVPERRPGLSPDQRRTVFGHNIARGVTWSSAEDAVIRKWFGMRTVGDDAGQHAALSPEMWAAVLEELKGTRSKHSVQQRMNALNRKLLTELLQRQQTYYGTKRSEGLRKSFVPEYMRRVLGERPRMPPTRERSAP